MRAEKYFDSHIIPEKARDLSAQLCYIIKPFVTPENQEYVDGHSQRQPSGTREHDSPEQVGEDMTPAELFEETFQLALK
jgi:hypothetical protein